MPTFTSVASSSFAGANEDPLSEGGNWGASTAPESNLTISSNVVSTHDANTDSSAWWIGAGSFNDNQYSKVVIKGSGTAGSGSGFGAVVRRSTTPGTKTMYRFVIDFAATNNAEVRRFVSGTGTRLGSLWTQAVSVGDAFYLAIEGQTVYVYDKNQTQVFSFDDTGGGGPTTGKPGIGYSSTDASMRADDWEGGNFVSSSTVLPSVNDTATITEDITVRAHLNVKMQKLGT